MRRQLRSEHGHSSSILRSPRGELHLLRRASLTLSMMPRGCRLQPRLLLSLIISSCWRPKIVAAKRLQLRPGLLRPRSIPRQWLRRFARLVRARSHTLHFTTDVNCVFRSAALCWCLTRVYVQGWRVQMRLMRCTCFRHLAALSVASRQVVPLQLLWQCFCMAGMMRRRSAGATAAAASTGRC